MAYFTFPFFHQRFLDNEGNPLAGGSLTFYRAGSTALKNIYLDQSGSPADNPMPLDSTGVPKDQYFAGEGEYDILISDANGNPIQKVLRITCTAGATSPFPDPENPGFLHWDGTIYEWIPIQMYPTPGNSGYLYYDAGTQTYSWVSITPDDHKVANSDTDIPGYLQDKIVDSDTVRWSEIIVDGNSVIKADMIDLDKVPVVVVWAIMAPTDPQTAPFGLSNDDVNHMIETGFGVASQMEQSTFQSNLSIWYATGTYWGDAVWEEKSFPDGSCITNLNHTDYDYLHTHPESRPVTDASNYPAGIYSIKMVGDGLYWEPLLVEQYPDPSYNITSFLKYDADNKVFVWLDAKLLEAKPIGPAGGDLFGTYPNPRVKELTGVPAMLTPSIAGFNWKQSGGWASGAGIGFGFGYVNGVQTRVWMAISQLGELQVSYDEWKSEVYIPEGMPYRNSFTDYDGNTQLYNDVQSKFAGRYAAVSYLEIPGTGKFCWVFGAEGALRGLEAVSTNFYTNGAPKLENMFAWSYNGTDPNTINSNGTVMVFTGNSSTINYAEAADIDWDNKIISAHSATVTGTNASSRGVIGGNGCNGSSFMCVGRDSGLVMQSADGKNWTVVDVLSNKFQDGSDMTKTSVNEYTNALPMNTNAGYNPAWGTDGNAWGGMLFANDMWIVVNGKPAPSTINTAWSPFMFSYDKSNWNGYMPTPDELAVNYSYSMYKIAYGHGKTFATNSDPFQDYKDQPAIYRLLMDEIPAHRKLVAEKGLDVIGTLALLDLPNAASLATDEDGNVIAGEGAIGQIGDAPKTDYVFSPFNGGTRKWVPNGKASGVVEALLTDLVVDNVNHTVTVPAYTVQLFDNNNFLGQPLRYSVDSVVLTISTAGVRQFITARYISPGVVQTILTPFVEDLNLSSQVPLFVIERTTYTDGSDLIHSVSFDTKGEGLPQKIEYMLTRTEPYRRSQEGGLIISSTTRQIQLTPSLVFAASTPVSVLAYDSSLTGHRLTHAYPVAGVWTYADESTSGQFNNTEYSDGTNLVTMGNNKWKNVWVYRSIGDDRECFYIEGPEYNTSDAAQDEAIPTAPSLLAWHCMLVGRITIEKSTSVGYIVKSAFTNPFAGSSVSSGYIRNQASDGTNDSPGHIFLAPTGSVQVSDSVDGTYPSTLMDESGFTIQNDVIDTKVDISGLHVHDRIEDGGQHAVYGQYSAYLTRFTSYLGALSSVTEDTYYFQGYDYNGVNNNYRLYQFDARLKFRIGMSDTVPAELEHKIVDSNGTELSKATNGSHGQALVIPTTQIAGTPNGQELFNYSLYESKNSIAQDGTSAGNNYGNRGFAMIALSSRRFRKARMMVSQTGGQYMRMAVYADDFTLIAKSPRVLVYGGIMSFDLNLNSSDQAVDGAFLIGGNRYYLAYWTDDTTGNLKFACLGGRNTESDSPQAQLFDTNNEMPAILGTSGTRTGYRPWMAIYEA